MYLLIAVFSPGVSESRGIKRILDSDPDTYYRGKVQPLESGKLWDFPERLPHHTSHF